MSYHRFIGGPHDGEWHNVQRRDGFFLPPVWSLAERRPVKLPLDPVQIEDAISRVTQYVPFPLHIGEEEAVTFFIERSMKPREALIRLAECYQPAEGKSE